MNVYLTYRNVDLTEGRGPMVVDKIFATRKLAEEYIDVQPGVQGRRAKWSQWPAQYGYCGDWEIKEMPVIDQ